MKRYRIVDAWTSEQPPVMFEFEVARKTPKGAWICDDWAVSRMLGQTETAELRKQYGWRYVLDGDGKRYAHETVDMARKSFKIRKQRQISHAKASIARAEEGLYWLETGKSLAPNVFFFDSDPTNDQA